VLRARIALLAAEGQRNDQIRQALAVSKPVVIKWRRRIADSEPNGLSKTRPSALQRLPRSTISLDSDLRTCIRSDREGGSRYVQRKEWRRWGREGSPWGDPDQRAQFDQEPGKEAHPEMRQTRKGNQWYFGMKAHIGVDARTKLIHSVATTPANAHDSQVLTELLHREEREVWGDSAYQGQGKVIREVAPQAREFIQEKAVRRRPLSEAQRTRNRIQSRIRAKVEHPFHIMKRVFGFTHVRYRGLAKNAHRVQVTCALANLFLVRKHLLKPALAME